MTRPSTTERAPPPVYGAFLWHDGLWLTGPDKRRYRFSAGVIAEHWLRQNGGGIIVYAVDLRGNVVEQVVCEPIAPREIARAA